MLSTSRLLNIRYSKRESRKGDLSHGFLPTTTNFKAVDSNLSRERSLGVSEVVD
jgi:hypothetical protein